jgi:hypothetical protein
MTLRSVGDALRTMRAATLSQLAAELSAPQHEIEALLAFWEHRGNVERCSSPQASGCGTACKACPIGSTPGGVPVAREESQTVVYEWVR